MNSFGPSRFENGKPMLLGGLRQRHALAATELDLAEQWRQFRSRGELPARVGTSSYGVMCGHDATGFEYMCGVEVESFAGLPDGTGRMRVPARRYAVFTHQGPASTLRSTWQRIFDWLSSGSYESAHTPDFELYGPDADPLEGAGGIEVWIGVVPRSNVSPDGASSACG
jgi:predicted transcriptional regulator YdeE